MRPFWEIQDLRFKIGDADDRLCGVDWNVETGNCPSRMRRVLGGMNHRRVRGTFGTRGTWGNGDWVEEMGRIKREEDLAILDCQIPKY